MKLSILASILLLTSSSMSTHAAPYDVDKVEEPLTDKEKLVGRWLHQRDETLEISFKWDGRLIYTEWLKSPEGKWLRSDHYGDWTLNNNVITMTFKNDVFKQYIKFHGNNSFSLITNTDNQLFNRKINESPSIKI